MGIFPEVERFVYAHRLCGDLCWVTSPPTPQGYRLRIACPCGAAWDCWVTVETAALDLLRTRLSMFLN